MARTNGGMKACARTLVHISGNNLTAWWLMGLWIVPGSSLPMGDAAIDRLTVKKASACMLKLHVTLFYAGSIAHCAAMQASAHQPIKEYQSTLTSRGKVIGPPVRFAICAMSILGCQNVFRLTSLNPAKFGSIMRSVCVFNRMVGIAVYVMCFANRDFLKRSAIAF